MNISPFLRQIIVASSPQLAAFSVGGITGFPAVLINQLSSNDSSIPIDLHTSSWIGSVHGIAGIPCLLISLVMQWKGRKLAFILSTIFIIIGWALMMIATKASDIIIAESLQGLGGNSIITVSLVTISEMVDPKLRPVSMVMYGVMQCVGTVTVTLIGFCLHWKSVSLIMFVPIFLSLMLACTWPESPSWLACQGEFERCEQAFKWLRGDGIDSKAEVIALIKAKKNEISKTNARELNETLLRRIRRRDFYLPCMHVFLLVATYFWSGSIAMFIYTVRILKNATGIASDFLTVAITDSVILASCFTSIFLVKRFQNKTILLTCGIGCSIALLASSLSYYLQMSGVLSSNSFIPLYTLLCYSMFCTSGLTALALNVAAELMPVKHRGIGGVVYTISMAVSYTSSIKATPYLFEYINYWGTFLVFATVCFSGTILIWKYVPETKNRTLQEIEDFYNRGGFGKCDAKVNEPFVKNES